MSDRSGCRTSHVNILVHPNENPSSYLNTASLDDRGASCIKNFPKQKKIEKNAFIFACPWSLNIKLTSFRSNSQKNNKTNLFCYPCEKRNKNNK